MPESFVLMTALPPTKGHLSLIQYAHQLTGRVNVIVCTQPGEPFPAERWESVLRATSLRSNYHGVYVHNLHRTLPQEPEGENNSQFWVMWYNILRELGFQEGDYIVSSEMYGIELAEAVGGVFMPFDMDRWITPTKASRVREDIVAYQDYILPEFLPYVRRKVTMFGAESVGKSTCAYVVGSVLRATITPEWARPYLEAVGPEVTLERMNRIYEGQKAIQETVHKTSESLYIIQDTDLFSTVGYWEMWDRGSMPDSLISDAQRRKSDLYVILSSDIPFKEDPLRYGGDRRESTDQYWIDLCERENLPYIYVTETVNRGLAVIQAVNTFFKGNPLEYQRVGREYEERSV